MQPPNILLLFTDQQRWDTIGALGNPIIRTPNVDRLVADGTAFLNAYSPSPVCVPARACMHYGQYPWKTGCYNNTTPMPDDGRPSFMDLLAQAGYRTHGIGKCHFTPNPNALRGFTSRERQEEIVPRIEDDEYLLFLQGKGFDHVRDPHGARSELVYLPQVSQLPQRLHPSQWVGDRSIAFLREQHRATQPWMLFSSFIHPHPPYAPPAPWEKQYRAKDMPPPHCPEGFEGLQPFISRSRLAHYYHDDPHHPTLWRIIRAHYYACVAFVDHQVGRIMEALEATGQAENTCIVFTSDHGDMLGDYGLMGKQCMFESSARVPMVVRFPGRLDAGSRCERPVSLVDIGPTLLTAAGLEAPRDWDGEDLAAVAVGRTKREVVFAQVNRGAQASYMAAGRTAGYAYSAPDRREYFSDRRHGAAETVTASAAGTEPMGTLKQALLTRLRADGETEGIAGSDWKPYPPPAMPDREAHRNVRDNPWADYRAP